MNVSSATSTAALPDSERDRLGSLALDQWRGLALVFVLISHGFFFTNRVNGLGRVGVNLFFFISGILVFRSLSHTRASTSWERSCSFWWRRLRRLYPAMITYTAAMLPLVWLLQNRPNLPPESDIGSFMKAVPATVVYGLNYYEAPMPLGHMWSLACEMQFYMIAPIIYLLGGVNTGRRIAVFGALLVVLMGLGLAQPFIGKWKYHFEFAVWPMMLGFCCEFARGQFKKIPERLVSPILWCSVIVCGISIALMIAGRELKPLVVGTGALLLAPCLMAYLFGRPMKGIGGSMMGWMGHRTYSIYLWQQPMTICNFLPDVLHPLGAAISVGVGGAWFHLFERPFLSGGRRSNTPRPEASVNHGFVNKLIAACVLFLALVAIAFGVARNRYQNQLRAQIWPNSVAAVRPVTNDTNISAPTVLLIGDSRMAQWDGLILPNHHVVNAGMGGFTTAQVRSNAAALLSQYRPETVVLQAGINDLKYLGLQPGLADQLVSLAFSNVLAVVNECENHGCRILLLKTWPADRPDLARRFVWSYAVSPAVDQFNRELQKLDSPARGIRVVDLFADAGLSVDSSLYRDTLHFKPEVYRRLTPFLEKELESGGIPGK